MIVIQNHTASLRAERHDRKKPEELVLLLGYGKFGARIPIAERGLIWSEHLRALTPNRSVDELRTYLRWKVPDSHTKWDYWTFKVTVVKGEIADKGGSLSLFGATIVVGEFDDCGVGCKTFA